MQNFFIVLDNFIYKAAQSLKKNFTKGDSSPKNENSVIIYSLLNLYEFLLLNTKEDILKNVGKQLLVPEEYGVFRDQQLFTHIL